MLTEIFNNTDLNRRERLLAAQDHIQGLPEDRRDAALMELRGHLNPSLPTVVAESAPTIVSETLSDELVQKIFTGINLNDMPHQDILKFMRSGIETEAIRQGGYNPIIVLAMQKSIQYALKVHGLDGVKDVKSLWDNRSTQSIQSLRINGENHSQESSGPINSTIQFIHKHLTLLELTKQEINAEKDLTYVNRSLQDIFEHPRQLADFVKFLNGDIAGMVEPVSKAIGANSDTNPNLQGIQLDPYSRSTYDLFKSLSVHKEEILQNKLRALQAKQSKLADLNERQARTSLEEEEHQQKMNEYGDWIVKQFQKVGVITGSATEGLTYALAELFGTTIGGAVRTPEIFMAAFDKTRKKYPPKPNGPLPPPPTVPPPNRK